jgi:SAM-dependent methyltransferase
VKQCRVCAGSLAAWQRVREMHFGTREVFDYLECVDCGCVQIDEIPADLDRYYPETYYTRATRDATPDGIVRWPGIRRAWTEFRLAAGPAGRWLAGRRYGRFEWWTRTTTRRQDSILDVGCGSGRLLQHLHRDGFTDLTGIDPALGVPESPNRSPRLLERDLEAFAKGSDAASASPGTPDSASSTALDYDVVMAHHSFEHVVAPRAAFAAFARLVRHGGWLVLRLPLADSWACEHYRGDWAQLDAPRHLHLHTRSSIARLAADFGFRIDRVVDDSGRFQISGSERIARGLPLVGEVDRDSAPSIAETVSRVTVWLTARFRARRLRRANRGDQACFYLQRVAPSDGPESARSA